MDFDNCAAEVPYDNGVTLGFRVTRAFEWSMAFFNPAWKLTPGASYSLTFTIDYSPPDTATAIAIGVAGVRVPLAPDVALFKRFMGGERLNVTAASENFGFNLTDTSKLLPDLLSCVESYSGAAPPKSNPFAPSNSLTASVAGTTWAGTDSDADYYEYTFQADGVLAYKSPGGFYTNGTWKQNGNGIYMETNHKFSERQGQISGTHMEGKAWNIQGHRWTWAADKR
jgi:hypothetical protein